MDFDMVLFLLIFIIIAASFINVAINGGFVGYVVLSSFDSLFDAFKTFFKKDNEEEKKSEE